MSSSLMEDDDQIHTQQPRQQQQQQQQQQHGALDQQDSFADLVVKAASGFNQMLLENCSMCTVYCDKQVQYESAVMESYVTGTALNGLFTQFEVDNHADVAQYQDMLFDEQSVVQSVSSRQED